MHVRAQMLVTPTLLAPTLLAPTLMLDPDSPPAPIRYTQDVTAQRSFASNRQVMRNGTLIYADFRR